MKKLSNKIKSIYTLTAILVLSLCMLLFPVAPVPASADEISDAVKNITVKSAYIQINNQLSETDETSEFAIMFKAKITKEDYNVITNNGQSNVKFGMLIGPTNRMESVTDYNSAIKQEFVAIANVGTRSSDVYQFVNFVESNEYTFDAGIVYNAEKLAEEIDDLKGAANLELSAIPYYVIDGTAKAIVENEKSCTPREILAESFIQEQDADITNIPEKVIKTYVGEVTTPTGEFYICRDSGRLMGNSQKGADLTPQSVAQEGDVVYLYGKKQAGVNTTALDADMLKVLPMYGEANLVVYKSDGSINKYSTKIAERVITRFADAKVGDPVTDTTKDYLANQSGSTYKSIFYVSQSGSAGANVWYYGIKGKTEGLYVLANDITIPSEHSYDVSKIGDSGYMGNVSAYNKKDAKGEYIAGDAWYGKSAYMIPTGNAGFMGILDGRGNNIDTNAKARYGIVPPAYNATIKNVGLLNLRTGSDFGGICTGAKYTTFENVYANISSVSEFKSDFSNPLAMMLDACTLNNVIIEANAVTADIKIDDDTVVNAMTKELTYGTSTKSDSLKIEEGNSGYGQNKRTTGVFSFKRFPDVYTDASGKWRYVANTSLTADVNAFIDNGAKTYLGKAFTASTIYTVRNNSYNSLEGDAFNGTTGNNVYTIGTSPLYVNHEYAIATGTGADYNNLPSLDPTTKTTVFVNSTLKYNNGTETLDTNTTDYYKLSTLVDTNGLFTINNDATYSLGEIIFRGKQLIYGESKVTKMLTLITGEGENATSTLQDAKDVLEVRLVTQQGWYDVASYSAMADYVNANTETPFDTAYWNVSNGVVTWKGLQA